MDETKPCGTCTALADVLTDCGYTDEEARVAAVSILDGDDTPAPSQPTPEARVDPLEWQVNAGETYRHYKGVRYVVLGVALESTNGRPRERVVIYQSPDGPLNVRDERQFTEWMADAGCYRFKPVRPEEQLPIRALPLPESALPKAAPVDAKEGVAPVETFSKVLAPSSPEIDRLARLAVQQKEAEDRKLAAMTPSQRAAYIQKWAANLAPQLAVAGTAHDRELSARPPRGDARAAYRGEVAMAIKWTSALCGGCGRHVAVEEGHGECRFVLHDKPKKLGGGPCPESGQPMPPVVAPKGTPSWLK